MTDESLFAAALELPVSERAAYLNAHCPDPAVRKQVADLLAAADASNPLDQPLPDLDRTNPRPTAADEPTAAVGDRVGPYKLLEKIGEGGMGEVWVADQLEPIKRRVALKLIKPGMDSRNVLARFEAERQALAVMDHSNIAMVLDAGTTPDGRPYFVMELVKGTPITEFADARKLTTQQRLELFVPVCQAIQHAHMKGIIHRDIKPSNVLVALHDETPVPKVIDFGVAKAVGQQLTDKTIYTGFGALVGTPAYMAPEQATFNQLDVDTRADVYALGVLLYELLAGSPPIEKERLKKAALDEVLRIVRDEEPPRPSQRLSTADTRASIAATRGTEPDKLSKLMKGELDWIVMKALEKDRTRRYDTANGFAADVQRYLSGEPVQAVPPSVGYRVKKFVRKHRGPVLATLSGLVGLVALVAALTFGMSEAGKKAELRNLLDDAQQARAEAESTRELFARLEYARTIDLTYRDYHANRTERAEELLSSCAERFRGWEWRYLTRLLRPEEVRLTHPHSVTLAAVSPDGTVVATGAADGIVRLWEAASGKPLRTFEKVDDTTIVGSVRFTPDGSGLLVAYYKSARLYDVESGVERLKLPHDDTVFSAAMNPAGTRIATCCQDRKARVWDAASGRLLVTVDRYPKLYGPIHFDPTGKTVLTTDGDQAARVWDAATGDERRTYPTRDYPRSARFSPDGSRVACAGSDKWVRVFNTSTGELIQPPIKVVSAEIEDFAFTPTGDRIVTADREGGVRTFEVATGRELAAFHSHAVAVKAVVWSADGKRLVTASDDRTARVWNADRLPGSEIVRPMIGLMALAVSPDGRSVAVGGREGEVQLWNLRTAEKTGGAVWDIRHGTGFIRSLAFSPDGRTVASASEDGAVAILSATTGKKVAEYSSPNIRWQCVSFHPTRDRVVASGLGGEVVVLDAQTAEVRHKLEHPADPVWAVAFTPDGRQLVTGGWDGRLRVWDADTWELSRTLDGGRQWVRAIALTQTGRMAVRHQGGGVRVWDLSTGNLIRDLACPREDGVCVAMTPDGERVATSGREGDVHVWDVPTGAELLSPVFRELRINLMKHPASVHPLTFSADGHMLVTGSFDQSFRVWDGTPLLEPKK